MKNEEIKESEIKKRLAPIKQMINVLHSEVNEPLEHNRYFGNAAISDFKKEVQRIKKEQNGKPGVYIMWGYTGKEANELIKKNLAINSENDHLKYETCIYIGKSIKVGQRVYDQLYNKSLSQIIPNAEKKGFEIANINPLRIEGRHNEERDPDGEFEDNKIYISDIDIITFDESNRGLAGRDVCEILLIQETDTYPLLNKQFAYRETGTEGFEEEER